MQSKRTVPYFQIALLVALTAIGVGIWRQKIGTPVTDDVPPAPISNVTTPKTTTQPLVNYDAPLPIDSPLPPVESLIDDLKSSNLPRLHQLLRHAQARRDGRYGFEMFLLAAEHGSLQSIQSIAGTARSFPHFDASPADATSLLTGVQRILDRGDKTTSQMVLSLPFNVNGYSRQQVLDEFTRTPWDRERFELVLTYRENEFRSAINELIVKSLDVSDATWEWFINKLTEWKSRNQLYAYDFEKALNSGGLVTSKTIDRLLRFLPFMQSGRQEFLVQYLTFLNAAHFDAVIAALSGEENFPPPLLEYVLVQDPEKINTLLDLNAAFRKQLKNYWAACMTGAEGTSVNKVIPVAKRILEFSQSDSSWVTFVNWSADGAERCDWLWSQGFRPNAQTPNASRLYLAVRHKDLDLLRQAMRSDGSELQYFLNNGLEIRQKLTGTESSTYFVPLLEIIRDWNLDAVTVITSSDLYKWSDWKHANPIAVAAKLQKNDVCQYLTKIGVPLNDEARSSIAAMNGGQDDLVDTLAKRDETEAGRLAPQLALQAARVGDLEMLVNAIGRIPFQRTPIDQKGKLSLEQRMQRGDFENKKWIALPGINETVIASIKYPHCFARLQFEGFPISRNTVEAIMESGVRETLEIALSDLGTRKQCDGYAESILNKAVRQPQMAKLYKELGMLNNLHMSEKQKIAELYFKITGNQLEVD